eukprot:COSAG06_NODE_82269_length_102_cov_123.333333_1_plen_33_part_11
MMHIIYKCIIYKRKRTPYPSIDVVLQLLDLQKN